MTYLFAFFIVWLALVLFSMLVIQWPREAKEIWKTYPKGLILGGFLLPSAIRGVFSTDHLQVFLRFRRRYLVFWISLLVISILLMVLSYNRFTSETESFQERMQEKYLSTEPN